MVGEREENMEVADTSCKWMACIVKEEVDEEMVAEEEDEEEEEEDDFIPAYAQTWSNEKHQIQHETARQKQKVKEEEDEENVQEMAVPIWTFAEDKLFEKALADYEDATLDRWERIAAAIPGKNVEQVKKHYQLLLDDVGCIEAGLIMLPNYDLESVSGQTGEGCGWKRTLMNHMGHSSVMGSITAGGRSPGKPPEQERRKGIPWTEEEHRLFLLGLEKYGKGDWRSISRNFVISRTPTQVASHAQKYFIRLNSINKDKRRSSIHDITSVNSSDCVPSGHSTPIMSGQPTPSTPRSHVQQLSLGRPPIYVPPLMVQPISGPVGSSMVTPVSPRHTSFAPGLHLPGLVLSPPSLPLPGSSVPMPHQRITYTVQQPTMHH